MSESSDPKHFMGLLDQKRANGLFFLICEVGSLGAGVKSFPIKKNYFPTDRPEKIP